MSGYITRRMEARDAPDVRACALRILGADHPRKELLDENALVELAASASWVPAVAHAPSGEFVGLLALELSSFGPIAEIGLGMVVHEHRRNGVAELLRDFLLGEAKARGLGGQFAEVGTIDLGAQAIAVRAGIIPCGVMLSIWEERSERASFVRYFRHFRQPLAEAPLFVPAHHRAIVTRIQSSFGRGVDFADAEEARELGELVREVKASWKSVFFSAPRIGRDTVATFGDAVRGFEDDAALETAYLDLPIRQPGAIALCLAAEALGFFFAGLTPMWFGEGEALRLQRLKTPLDVSRLLIDDGAREILAHVHSSMMRAERTVTDG